MKRILFLFFILILCIAINGSAEINIREIQQAIDEKGANWNAEDNRFTRMSKQERKNLLGGEAFPQDMWNNIQRRNEPSNRPNGERDEYLDWRDYNGNNYITSIKDQGQCGSCTMFGTNATLESRIAISFDVPDPTIDLSEQYPISCGPGSCGGTWFPDLCEFMMDEGTPTEDCLPYFETDDIPCSDRCEDYQLKIRKIQDWAIIDSTVAAIKAALQNGPVGARYHVYEDFYSYTEGVYEHVYGEREGAHVVSMVGYDDSLECWICKNSWGPDWGEDGYFRISWWDEDCEMNKWSYWLTPAETVYPDIDYLSYTFQDTIQGDNDGILNPGETTSLQIKIINQPCWQAASGITATLASEDDRITIINNQSTYPDLQSGDFAYNETDFEIAISADSDLEPIPVTLHLEANQNGDFYYVNLEFNIELSLNQAHWPITTPNEVRSSPIAFDINGDGHKEIIFGCNDKNVYVKTLDGSDLEGFPFSTNGTIFGSPAIGDVDNDGDPEIVTTSFDGNVYIIHHTGELLNSMEVNITSVTPALSDLDNDGDLEIVVGTTLGNLYVLHHTGESFSDEFPYYMGAGAGITAGAAIADINGDESKDIVVGCMNNNLYAISLNGEILSGFPYETGDKIRSAPSVCNLDGTGNKIAIGALDDKFYMLNNDGTLFSLIVAEDDILGSPTFADVDQNGSMEIFFGANDGYIYGVNSDGTLMDGWPQLIGYPIQSSPAFSDLDSDGNLEIVFADLEGNIHGLTSVGDEINPFPIATHAELHTNVAISDIDGDSDLEIVYGNNNSVGIIDYKTESPEQADVWKMYRANPHRTGFYGDLGESFIQTPNLQNVPQKFDLGQNYPNPFNPITNIQFSLPKTSDVRLAIYDITGKLVKNLVDETRENGYHSVIWHGRDENNRRVASGIYFYTIEAGNYTETKSCILLK